MPFLLTVVALGLSLAAHDAGSQKDAGSQNEGNQRQDLFRRIVPQPTGRNGYEEYLRAAEMLSDPEFGFWRQLDAGEVPKKLPIGLTTGSSYLDRRRWLLARYRPALDLVRQGNAKAVFDPRTKLDVNTLFPEYAAMRQVSRAMVAASYAEFAAGDSAAGTRRLVDGLIMGTNVSGTGPIISHLVGVAIMRLSLAEFEGRLSGLSQRDCDSIIASVDEMLRRPNSLLTTLSVETQFVLSSFDAAPEQELSKIEAAALPKLKKAVERLSRQRLAQVSQVLSGPEHQWPLSDPPEDEEDMPDMTQNVDAAAEYLVNQSFANVYAIARTAAISRTQLRLLRLHALIQRFRWHHNRLPHRLEEAVENPYDPLNNGRFVYELNGATYRLYSKGRDETGEIELKIKRANRPEDTEPAPPRLLRLRNGKLYEPISKGSNGRWTKDDGTRFGSIDLEHM